MKFQYYSADIKNITALGFLTLDTFIDKTKCPKEEVKVKFEKLKTLNGKEKDDLKKTLYYFTPSVKVKQIRNYENIYEFTGLLVLDFDKLDNAELFKEYLFETYSYVICAYTSPSRRGVKAICKIPIVNTIEEYKSIYYGIAEEMEQYEGFDISNQNPVLPLFGSYDPNILTRTDYTEFNKKGVKINEYDYTTVEAPKEITISSYDKEKVLKRVEKLIDKIYDNGHPQVVSASLVTGGYVASGYISEYEAEQILIGRINTNSYLNKGVRGYINTMRRFLKEGQRKPIYL